MAFKPYKSNTWLSKYFDENGNRKEIKEKTQKEFKRSEVPDIKITQTSKSVDVSGKVVGETLGAPEMGKRVGVQGRAPFGPQTLNDYYKKVNEDFLYNQQHPFYKEAIERYGMPNFTTVIKMNDESKPIDLMMKVKTTDGKEMVDTINPLFMKLGIVDVKKKVYQYKITDEQKRYSSGNDVGGYSIITTPREYNVIGENKDNYYYLKDGVLVSLAKTDVSETKPSSGQLEALWKQSINDIIDTVRKTTADDERAMEEELKVYGTENIEDDIRVLKQNGVVGNDFEIGDLTPARIRQLANIEREKDKPLLERLGEAEGAIGNIQAVAGAAKDYIGQTGQRLGQIIPEVYSGQGIPQQRQSVGTGIIGGVTNFVSDLLGYGIGLAGPGSGGVNIASDAYQVGEKATALAGQKIGAKLGAGISKYIKSPNALKIINSPVVGGALKGAVSGAASMPMITGYEAAAQELTPQQTLEKGVAEAGLGAGVGAIAGGIGGAITKRLVAKEAAAKEAAAKEAAAKEAEKVKKLTEENKYSKENYKKKYGLGEKVSAKEETKRVENVIKETGKKVEEKVGTKEPKKILEYYKGKYKKELKDVKLQATLKAEGTYGKTSKNAKGELVIKYNPKNDPDIIAGTIRHEIEHVLDQKRGFKGVDRAINNEAKTIYDRYASKIHHKYYDFFEPEYIRRQDVKNALNAGEKVPKNILKELGLEGYKPIEPIKPTTESKTIPSGEQGISRFRGTTVPESEATTEAFKNELKRRDPVKYNIASNHQDWDEAVDKVFKNPENTWSEIRNKNKIGRAGQKGYTSKDSAEMMALIEYHEKNKNYDAANEVLEYLSQEATGAGQFIQALSIWDRRTPEGMLRYAKYKVNKGIQKKFPNRDILKNEISDLKNTIKSLENKKKNATGKELKSIEDDISLHSRRLTGKEKDLETVERKIAAMHADLKPEDSQYITERMKEHKSQALWDENYNKKLNALTEGNVNNATEKQVYKAREYADRQKDIALKRALTKIADLEPTTFREKIRAIQRINLLTNARTAIRNNVSNAVFGAIEMTRENTAGAFVDYVAAAARTKSFVKPITNKAASGRTTVLAPIKTVTAYVRGLKKGTSAVMNDIADSIRLKEHISTAATKGPFEVTQGKVFKGTNVVSKTLNKMDNVVKTLVTDRPFYEAAKEVRIEQLKKIMKTNTVTEDMENAASLFALDKVFQNDSAIAQTMTMFRKKVPGSELIMPFSQTPGNVLDKLVDYTPGGLLKVLYQFGYRKTKGFDTKLAVDRISRTLSGAGIALLAWGLADKGLISGNLYAMSSKKMREYEITKGKKSYAMKVNGKWYTYDWLTPVGGILSAVADLRDIQGSESSKKALEVMIGSPLNTVANQSFLSGIFALFSEQSISEGLIKGVAGSASQAVPLSTLARQIATFTDKYERDTTSEGVIGGAIKRTMKGVPGLREKLEVKTDLFGKPISTESESRTYDFFKTFVIPSNIGVEKRTNITNELDHLIAANKEEKSTNILPSAVSDTIRFNKEDYELNSVQYTKYKKMYGQTVSNMLNELFGTTEYRRASSADKFKMVKRTYSDALEEAKKKALKSFGYKVEES